MCAAHWTDASAALPLLPEIWQHWILPFIHLRSAVCGRIALRRTCRFFYAVVPPAFNPGATADEVATTNRFVTHYVQEMRRDRGLAWRHHGVKAAWTMVQASVFYTQCMDQLLHAGEHELFWLLHSHIPTQLTAPKDFADTLFAAGVATFDFLQARLWVASYLGVNRAQLLTLCVRANNVPFFKSVWAAMRQVDRVPVTIRLIDEESRDFIMCVERGIAVEIAQHIMASVANLIRDTTHKMLRDAIMEGLGRPPATEVSTKNVLL